MSLIAELKRRNVLRACALYIGASWALTQGFAQLFPVFGVPDFAVRWIVIFAVTGFPFFAAFAWFYEFTPDGLKRESEIAADDSIAHSSGKKLDRWIIAVLALAVVLLLTDRLTRQPGLETDKQAAIPAAITEKVSEKVTDKSIAVLPFENLSEDKANGYFADGIQDQILTSLAQIGDLKVISRTSTQKYASRPDNLSQIAKELGVAHILEGSVQKSGNRARVNVQLIQADTDSHLWAQTYDRTLDDIFAVESEVAEKIALSLTANLSGVERSNLSRKPTESTAAYDAYLRARAANTGTIQTRQEADRVLDAYREAVRLDPGFALAWVQLARELFKTNWLGLDPSGELRIEGEQALARATELAPASPQTAIARGVYMYYMQRDFAGALEIMNAMKAKLPNDADLWVWAGYLSRRLGQWRESVTDFEHARELSPNDGGIAYHLAVSVVSTGDCQRGIAYLDAALKLVPGNSHAVTMKMQCAWADGDLPRAATYLQAADARLPVVQGLHGVQLLMQRDYAAAAKELQRASTGNDDTLIDAFLAGYLPARIEFQLQLALAEQRSGNEQQAQAIYRQVQAEATNALAGKPDNRYVETGWHCVLGLALAGLGERKAAAEQGRMAMLLVPESADRLEGPLWSYYNARILALNGDAAEALPILRHLLQTPAALISVENLRLDPVWDQIREDPGFQALLKQDAYGNTAELKADYN